MEESKVRLSFTDSAERILREASQGQPMHYLEILELAIARGYLETQGKTPGSTLISMIGTENRRRMARGEEPRFVVHGDGFYSLANLTEGIEQRIIEHNDDTRARLRIRLQSLPIRFFERILINLLSEIGYEDIENHGEQYGYEILFKARLSAGAMTSIGSMILALRETDNIDLEIIRELRGILGPYDRGLLIATTDFTDQAREESMQTDKPPVSLISGEHLVNLLVEKKIGVARHNLTLLKLDSELQVTKGGWIEVEDSAQDRNQVRAPDPADARVASIWPLPGGADKYADTLFKLLDLIAEENPSQEDVATWFLENYRNVRSRNTTRGYLQVLQGLGLIRHEDQQIVVTQSGRELAVSHSLSDLRKVLEDRLLGIREIYRYLSHGAAEMEQVHDYLLAELGLGWQTTSQTEWRLAWLQCVGAIEEANGMYTLAEEA